MANPITSTQAHTYKYMNRPYIDPDAVQGICKADNALLEWRRPFRLALAGSLSVEMDK